MSRLAIAADVAAELGLTDCYPVPGSTRDVVANDVEIHARLREREPMSIARLAKLLAVSAAEARRLRRLAWPGRRAKPARETS